MQKASHATSLILICPASCSCFAQVESHQFERIFAFGSTDLTASSGTIQVLPEDTVGASLLRRLHFFAEPEQISALLAPLLVRALWKGAQVGNVVISYPGLGFERVCAAEDLILAGCEAVLLRGNGKTSLVLALARNLRNERLVGHWADCVEQFSLDPSDKHQFDCRFGVEIVEHLCDRIASIRGTPKEQVTGNLDGVQNRAPVPHFLREAVRKLLPDSRLLLDDPFGNAIPVLNAPSPKVKQEPRNLISCLMFVIWSARPDLQTAFDLSTVEGRQALGDWFLSRAPVEYGIGDEFLAPVRAARENDTAVISEEPREGSPEAPIYPQFGVNLVGYPRADMGMGELLRQSAAALSTTKVPFCVVDFNFGITASQKNMRYESLMRADNPMEVNLFHINADQMSLVRDKLGQKFFRDHYNIGYWTWELSKFPTEWNDSIDLVDEIWAPSRFIRNAIAANTSKPVLWMPLAVEFSLPNEQDLWRVREGFDLPQNKFLFLFSFDFSSFATRKNFKACIEAFRTAFPDSNADAGLVLKTIRHSHQTREYWELLGEIGDDPRVFAIDRILSQVEMRELMAACDSFVSLHRSEGFGLAIAEAMYLGKSVIATNYSGNTDFTKPDNSCLVDYQLVPLQPNDYVFAAGQVWAEPDINQAAEYMRRLVADRKYARQIGRAASTFIRQHHNCKKIGERCSARLRQIESGRALLGLNCNLENEADDRSFKTTLKSLFHAGKASG